MIFFPAKAKDLRTPLTMLYHWEKKAPNRMYLNQPISGQWNSYTWGKFSDNVRRMASAIKSKNFPKGSHIAIISKNCAHWLMADYAIWMAGHVSIPLYPNLNRDTVRKILAHSEAKLAFIGKLDDWPEIKEGIPQGFPTISFPYEPRENSEKWDEVITKHAPMSESPTRELDEVSTIIYTSGTTGDPKGVVHSFRTMAYAAENAVAEFQITPKDRFFSYLPLAHVAERLLTELVPLYGGATVSYAESLDKFPTNVKDTAPTVFLAVPRLWNKFKQKILQKMPEEKLNKLLRIPVVSSLVKMKIQKGLGTRKARVIGSGAAAIPEALQIWFAKLGIPIQDCYAMTENLAYSYAARADAIKIGYSGQPLPGVDVKLSESGEVLVKSGADLLEYYKNPEETKKIFTEDRFIRTGDLGELDDKGYLKITGRAKDNFKTSKGKYVAPSPIEKKMSESSHIEQICVVGDGLSQPMALVILSENAAKMSRDLLNSDLETSRKNTNSVLDHHEHVCKIVVLKEEWSPENNFLTPSLKVKRNVVEAAFSPRFEEWASQKTTIIWQD